MDEFGGSGMNIVHDLLPAQKTRKRNLKVTIDLYPITTELYNELERIGIIDRIKDIPQLGLIKVKKELKKSRYDYAMLQLYFHQLIRQKIQPNLRLSYGNHIKNAPIANKETNEYADFGIDVGIINKSFAPSIADAMQTLSIVYNIGHFYNTFTSSRAVVLLAAEDIKFRNLLLEASREPRYKETVTKLLEAKNYQKFHLVNSLLILEHCNQRLPSVLFAKELLYAYINEQNLPENSKLKYVFDVFRKVRTLSYMAYDLQIAKTPFTIDITNGEALLILMTEWLSEYNNTMSPNHLINSMSKLLDDTVYNENSNAICYYRISKRIVGKLKESPSHNNTSYYNDLFLNKESVLNVAYSQSRNYIEKQILKLTFSKDDRNLSFGLIGDLESLNNTRVGYYDRRTGEQTIVASIKSSCNYEKKTLAALKIIRKAISALRKIGDISTSDTRYILCVKFFLFYLFRENPAVIVPTISKEKCVFCTRGKKSRINEVKRLLNNNNGSEDQAHECKFLVSVLNEDKTNDTTLTVPASIQVYDKNTPGKKLCEFDGIIIHPLRERDQVIFLEAKNISHTPSEGKNCLLDKFKKLSIPYSEEDIKIRNYDAFMKYCIRR